MFIFLQKEENKKCKKESSQTVPQQRERLLVSIDMIIIIESSARAICCKIVKYLFESRLLFGSAEIN